MKFELGGGRKIKLSLYDDLNNISGETAAHFWMQAISAKNSAVANFEFCNTITFKADIVSITADDRF